MRLDRTSLPGSYALAMALLATLSLWLRMNFPVMAIASSHDDLLYVRQALSIAGGEWLGPYDNLTHAKGVAYPVFIALNNFLGLPLKVTEHLVYLAAALWLSTTLGRLHKSRVAALVTFALLAFIPAVWNPGVGGRVVGENLGASLSLLMLMLALHCWVLWPAPAAGKQRRPQWPALVGLGLLGGVFWIAGEDAAWMWPSLALFVGRLTWLHGRQRAWKSLALLLAIPLAAMLTLVGTVDAVNFSRYGVFRNNDFRSAEFQAAMDALARIRHDAAQRFVVLPRDARERAYAMSAAARELKPFFEGQGGENWRAVGCNETGRSPCTEILSGWFKWALRDAVAAAGHYRSAPQAQRFYQQLAAEIQAGCQQTPTACLPEGGTAVPPWQGITAMDVLRQAQRVIATLVDLGPDVRAAQSLASPQQIELFALATNGPVASDAAPRMAFPGYPTTSPRDARRLRLALWSAGVERDVARVGFPLACFVSILWWVSALVIRRRTDASLMLSMALAAAVATRVLWLAFLEETTMPSNTMLNLYPVAPMALALVPVAWWGAFRFIRPLSTSHDQEAPPAQAVSVTLQQGR